MSYDIYRIFADEAIEPSEKEIRISGPGSNCVPTRPGDGDAVHLYCDAIILSVRRLGKTYNILYWKTWDDNGKPKSWDSSIFSPVPTSFRWRTGAYPIVFPQVIKPDSVRHAALEFFQVLVFSQPEFVTKENIAACFYTQQELNELLSD